MKINDNCIACGACMEACPSDAIRRGPIYKIDSEACVECGACEAACSSDAIESA